MAGLRRAIALASLTFAARAAADPTPPGDEPPAVVAPAGSDEVVPGEVIVVTGLRLPRALRDLPPAVTVIDRAQIARSPHALSDELVREAPMVGTFRRSSSAIADPTSQGLNLRGVGPSGVSRALVLRDGLPVNDPFGGWVYWRALPTLDIERIEIAPSGASALFGNFALGGVLHVISRPIEGRAVDAIAAAGSLGTLRAAARATERLGDYGVALDAEGLRTDGYTPIARAQRGPVDGPAASHHASGGLRVERVRGDTAGHAEARAFTESLDAGTQHTTADVRTLTYDAGVRLRTEPGTLEVQLFGGTQRFEQERARLTANRATATTASKQRTPSNNQGLVATWTGRPLGAHELVVGVDAQRVAGTARDALAPAMVEAETLIARRAGGEQRFAGVFAQDAIHVSPALELAAAVRLDAWQNVDARRTLTLGDGSAMTAELADASEVQLDPRLGALVHVTRELAIRASGYRAFRAPTLNELYRPFQVGTILTAANAQLRPETLWGGELGTQIILARVGLQATAFWNQLHGAIANVTLAEPVDGAARMRQNLGETRVAGLDLELSWHVTDAWTARVAHAFSDGRVTSAPAQPALVGKRLAQDPHQRTTAALSYAIAAASAGVQVRYLGRQFEDDLNTQPIGAVVLVDVRADVRLGGGISVFASGQNLLDRRYLVGRAGIDTEGAPRTFELGVAYHLGSIDRGRSRPL